MIKAPVIGRGINFFEGKTREFFIVDDTVKVTVTEVGAGHVRLTIAGTLQMNIGYEDGHELLQRARIIPPGATPKLR